MSLTVYDSARAVDCPVIGYPTLVASPVAGFGNALSFDGVVRGGSSTQGVDAGPTSALTVQGVGAAAAFCLEARHKTGSSVSQGSILAGRYSNSTVGAAQPTLYYTFASGTSGPFVFWGIIRDNAGVVRQVTGTTALQPNTTYAAALTYDGTTMRLLVNGVIEASLAVTGVEAPDTTTHWMIGRDYDTIQGGAANGAPTFGVIDEVRLSKVARYTANYTPATTPFTTDVNTLGLWHLDTLTVVPDHGPAFYPQRMRSEGSGANIADLTPDGTLAPYSYAAVTGNTGIGAAVKNYQFWVGGATSSANGALTTGVVAALAPQHNGNGWLIPPTTVMGGSSLAQRYIPAGSPINFTFNLNQTGLVGNFVAYFAVMKLSGGVYTDIGNAAASVTASPTGTSANATASGSTSVDAFFVAGDSLYVEVLLQVPGETAAAATGTLGFNPSTPWNINPPNGILTQYPRAASDTTPSLSDSTTRTTVTVRRTAPDFTVSTDTTSRLTSGSRTSNETTLVADSAPHTITFGRSTTYYFVPTDPPVTVPDRSIRGFVRNEDGTIFFGGATVYLIRDADQLLCQTTTSSIYDGSYVFPRDHTDTNTYRVEAQATVNMVSYQDISERGLVPQ